MSIAAITFDLDDTLWPIMPTITRAERCLQQWLREHCPDLSLADTELAQLRQEVTARYPELQHDFSALRIAALREVLLPAGYSEDHVQAGFQVFFAARNQVELYHDAEPALRGLGQRYRLAAISNGNAELGQIGLQHHFEFAVQARQVGKPKPHQAIFQYTLQRLSLSPEQVLHVGDHPEQDIDGALDAGLRAVWLNRSSDKHHRRADATVSSLAELPAIVQRLNA